MIIDKLIAGRPNSTRVSLMKTVSWRIVGTLDTILVSYLMTGKVKIALSIGGLEVVTKMILYYLHERAWIKLLNQGRGDAPEA